MLQTDTQVRTKWVKLNYIQRQELASSNFLVRKAFARDPPLLASRFASRDAIPVLLPRFKTLGRLMQGKVSLAACKSDCEYVGELVSLTYIYAA